MSDSENKIEELERELDRLESKVDSQNRGKNRIEVRAYDLAVSASSEEASMKDLQEVASDEMETLQRRALVGEYQELEEQNLFGAIFGED